MSDGGRPGPACPTQNAASTLFLAYTQSLYLFIVYLVRDLCAPLEVLDQSKETCMRVVAEHGNSAGVLRAFLDMVRFGICGT